MPRSSRRPAYAQVRGGNRALCHHDPMPDPLRIGLVCPYSLSIPGGVQAQVMGMARELRRRGHEARVLGPCDGPPPASVRDPTRELAAPRRERIDRPARSRSCLPPCARCGCSMTRTSTSSTSTSPTRRARHCSRCCCTALRRLRRSTPPASAPATGSSGSALQTVLYRIDRKVVVSRGCALARAGPSRWRLRSPVQRRRGPPHSIGRAVRPLRESGTNRLLLWPARGAQGPALSRGSGREHRHTDPRLDRRGRSSDRGVDAAHRR